jgi:alanine racemase
MAFPNPKRSLVFGTIIALFFDNEWGIGMEVLLNQMRPTLTIVEMDNIIHNLRALMKLTDKQAKTMAVVKADAYGHGIIEVSKACLENGANCLAVAILEEGILLRENGVKAPILVLGTTFPERARDIVKYDLIQGVSASETIKALALAAKNAKKPAKIHIKVETGMNRLGAIPGQDLKAFITALKSNRDFLSVEGAFSHFAKADAADKSYAEHQYGVFLEGIGELESAGFNNLMKHMANSAAIIDLPHTHLDMVRQGISLYGYYPSPDVRQSIDLRPAMSWITHVAHIKRIAAGSPIGYGCTHKATRESVIATLPVGYADGYPRLLSNCGKVIMRERKAPVTGRVCMDQLMVDVTDIEHVKIGDQVILIGQQDDERTTADDLANLTGTISYEILTGISPRVPRIINYKGERIFEDRLNSRKLYLSKRKLHLY